MPFLSKLNELKRVRPATGLYLGWLLFKKRLGIPLADAERESLAFFDCLALADGRVVHEDRAELILTLPARTGGRMPVHLRRQSSDQAVFKQILCWDEYEPVVALFKKQFADRLGGPICILDAGANIGLTAMYFRRCFDQTRIVCVEPDAGNFARLTLNLAGTGATLLQGAVWSRKGRIRLRNDFRDGQSWSLRAEELSDSEATGIRAYSLGQIMQDAAIAEIDILKIDVEGAEKEIFAGSELPFLRNTRCLAIEIHDEFDCREAIYRQLREHQFDFATVGAITVALNKAYCTEQHHTYVAADAA